MTDYERLYIGGEWVASEASDMIDVIDPATEQLFARVPAGSAADVAHAVAAARAAFPEWSQVPPGDRGRLLTRIAEEIGARTDELATIVSHELGSPKSMSELVQVGVAVATFQAAAALMETFEFDDRSNGLVVREPVGVVGCITPWNFPLGVVGAKVAYALAAGCTVVLKPSELAPVGTLKLAEIIDSVGLPPGVFNLVTGYGPVAGERLASHPDVDMISLTGSTGSGKRVAELAAQTIKRVALELGGKSPNVILDDADLATAVAGGVGMAFINSGQTCAALTRMIVPRARLAEVEEIASANAAFYAVGEPFAEGVVLGPLVSETQRDRVRRYIELGIEEGARLVMGGAEAPDGLETGYYVQPTIFSDVTSDMTIAQEEIFGPVLSIMPYDSEEEAIAIANDSIYGLSGAVHGEPAHAEAVARRLRTGQVSINGGFSMEAPFGGYKQSGLGREHGARGLEEFLETKALMS